MASRTGCGRMGNSNLPAFRGRLMRRRGRETRRTGSCRHLCQVWVPLPRPGCGFTVVTVDLAANMIGRSNARRGARRIFAVLQNRRLNQHIVYTIIDEVGIYVLLDCQMVHTNTALRCSQRCSLKLSKASGDTIRYLAHTLSICMYDGNRSYELSGQ